MRCMTSPQSQVVFAGSRNKSRRGRCGDSFLHRCQCRDLGDPGAAVAKHQRQEQTDAIHGSANCCQHAGELDVERCHTAVNLFNGRQSCWRRPQFDPVRAEQFVDGAAQTDGERGMSAPDMARAGDLSGRSPCSDAAAQAKTQRE